MLGRIQMATLLKVDGTKEEITPKDGESFSIEELWTIIGGYIEMVDLSWLKKTGQIDPDIEAAYMIVDEEGKLKRLPVNEAATKIVLGRDVIAGPALLCSNKEFK